MIVDKLSIVGLSICTALLFSSCKARVESQLAGQSFDYTDEEQRINKKCKDIAFIRSSMAQWDYNFKKNITSINLENYCKWWDQYKFVGTSYENGSAWVVKPYRLRLYIEKTSVRAVQQNPLVKEAAFLTTAERYKFKKQDPNRPNAPALPEEATPPKYTEGVKSFALEYADAVKYFSAEYAAAVQSLSPQQILEYNARRVMEFREEYNRFRPAEPIDDTTVEKRCDNARQRRLPAITYQLDTLSQPNLVRNLLVNVKLKFWDEQELRLGTFREENSDFIVSGLRLPSEIGDYPNAPFFVQTDPKNTFDRRNTATIDGSQSAYENQSGILTAKHQLRSTIPQGSLVSFIYNPSPDKTNSSTANGLPFVFGISDGNGQYEMAIGMFGSGGFPIAIGTIDQNYTEPGRDARKFDWRSYSRISDEVMPALRAQAKENPKLPKKPGETSNYFMISCAEIIKDPIEPPWELPGTETPN